MAKPQNSPRGLFSKNRIDVKNSTGTASLTPYASGLVVSGGIKPSAGAGGAITADSTAVILSALKIGALATAITANSTGIKIGSLYISGNSTGNTTT